MPWPSSAETSDPFSASSCKRGCSAGMRSGSLQSTALCAAAGSLASSSHAASSARQTAPSPLAPCWLASGSPTIPCHRHCLAGCSPGIAPAMNWPILCARKNSRPGSGPPIDPHSLCKLPARQHGDQRPLGLRPDRRWIAGSRYRHGGLRKRAEQNMGEHVCILLPDEAGLHRCCEGPLEQAEPVLGIHLAPLGPTEDRRGIDQQNALRGRLRAHLEEGTDAVRAMLAEEVRLELVNKSVLRRGRGEVGGYFATTPGSPIGYLDRGL